MKDILKLGFALMIYGLIAGISLGYINSITKPIIDAQEKAAKETAIKEVLPDTVAIVNLTYTNAAGDEVEYSVGYSDAEKTNATGYAVTANGNGFSSIIKTIVGLDTAFNINKIAVVYQNETPGLGTRCVEEGFKSQFVGKAGRTVAVDKDGGDIVAITGATITSRAVAASIKDIVSDIENNIPKTLKSDSTEDTLEIGANADEDIAGGGEDVKLQ